MKKGRSNLFVLLSVLVIIGILTYLALQQDKKYIEKKTDFFPLDSAKVVQIILKHNGNEIMLNKKGNEWWLSKPVEHIANQDYVKKIITDMKSVKVSDPISENPKKFQKFSVDDSTGIYVEYKAENKSFGVYLGKISSDYAHMYIRPAEQNKVYIISARFRYEFARKPDEWRDKTILKLNKDEIGEITYMYPKEEFKLQKGDSLWVGITNKNDTLHIDNAVVNNILSSLSNLKTYSFVDSLTDNMDFSKPDLKMDVKMNNGDIYGLFFLKDAAEKSRFYLIQKESNPNMAFKIYKYMAERIMKHTEDFKKDKPSSK